MVQDGWMKDEQPTALNQGSLVLPDPSVQLLASVDYASSTIAHQSCHASADQNKVITKYVSMLNDKFQRMALKNEGSPRRAALLSTYMMLATCLRPVNFKE